MCYEMKRLIMPLAGLLLISLVLVSAPGTQTSGMPDHKMIQSGPARMSRAARAHRILRVDRMFRVFRNQPILFGSIRAINR
jgi:hypothetical protein